jgi:hypothetical protein
MAWGGADDNGKRREGASDDGSEANVVALTKTKVACDHDVLLCCFLLYGHVIDTCMSRE